MVVYVPRTQRKDPQKKKVYKLEGQFLMFNRGGTKLSDLRDCIRLACAMYDVPDPGVRSHKGKEWSYSNGVTISFNKDQMNYAVALHEAAHHIVEWLWGEDSGVEDHGREFQGVYQWLLVLCGIAPVAALQAAWEAQGLKWKPIPPRETPDP